MALDPYDEELWRRNIGAAEQDRDRYLGDYDEDVEKFTGGVYGEGFGAHLENKDPENFRFEFATFLLPQVAYNNPRMRITSPRVSTEAQIRAHANQRAVNRWIKMVNMKALNEELATDFILRWAIGYVDLEPMAGMEDREHVPGFPVLERISLKRFIWDPMALDWQHWRYCGHKVVEDKEDILDRAEDHPEEEWYREAIEMLSPFGDDDHSRTSRYGYQNPEDQNLVSYYKVWSREDLDEHPDYDPKLHHGTWLTVAVVGDSGRKDYTNHPKSASISPTFIRAPYPARADETGPYEIIGAYKVPDEAAPLSPTYATTPQGEDVNNHARASARSAADYKRLVLVNEKQPKLQQTIAGGKHDYVYPFPTSDDLRQHVMELEIGGITPQHVSYLGVARGRLDRMLGMSDAIRGTVTGQGTATENSIAQAYATSRAGYLVQKFRDGITGILKKVVFLMDSEQGLELELGTDGQDVRITLEDGSERKMTMPRFKGGLEHEDEEGNRVRQRPLREEMLDFDIEVFSMEHIPGPVQQARLGGLMAFLQFMAGPGLQAAPIFAIDEIADFWGELQDMPDLKRLVDTKAIEEYGAQMLQMQGMQLSQGGKIPQVDPRLSADRSRYSPQGARLGGNVVVGRREPGGAGPSNGRAPAAPGGAIRPPGPAGPAVGGR